MSAQDNSAVTVAVIGLGNMGGAMATRLVDCKFKVRAYDISADAVKRLAEKGAFAASSPRDAAEGSDFVISSLPMSEHVMDAAVSCANPIIDGMSKSALYIEMSTIDPTVTLKIGAAFAARGLRMIDAPVGRQPLHCLKGMLLVMAGGADADLDAAMPVLSSLGETVVRCGELGAGAKMKVINNYMTASACVLTAETFAFAGKLGLDREKTLEVLRQTPAGRGHMNTTFPDKVFKDDVAPGFSVGLAHKDLGICLDVGARSGAQTLLASVSREAFGMAMRDGWRDLDWTAMLKFLEGAPAPSK